MRRSRGRCRGPPRNGGSYAAHLEDLDVPGATFGCPDLTTFCRLDKLGLVVVGQRLEPDRAVLACRVLKADDNDGTEGWCPRCRCAGRPRDTVTRELAHEPLGWRPTTLLVTIRRYRCTGCGHVWRQDTSRAAEPWARLSRHGLAWALEAIVCQPLSIACVAQGLGVAWNAANDAVLPEGRRVLINDPGRSKGVKGIGVDEHVWRHTSRGDKYVTVIIDLTPVRAGTGSARLLDMVPGRSKAAFKAWLTQRPRRGARPWRSSRGTGSAASRPPPLRRSPLRSRWPPSTWCAWPATPSTAAAAAFSRAPAAAAAVRTTRSTVPGEPCTPVPTCSPTSRPPDSRPCSPSMNASRSRPPGPSTSG